MVKTVLANGIRTDYEWKLNKSRKQKMGRFSLEEYDDRFELWALVIFDRYRGKGHSLKMIEEIIGLTKDKKIVLYVQCNNERAVHVYQKAGFQITDKGHVELEFGQRRKILEMTHFKNQEAVA